MRIGWIDMLRGFAILCILYFHTEMYYAGTDVLPYALYVDGVLSTFFFISGYLLLKGDIDSFDWKRRMRSIVRKLVIPYFVFTTLIAILKACASSQPVNLQEIAISIITGNASWFVAALIVAEVIITLLLAAIRSEWVFWAFMPVSLVVAQIWGNRLSSYYLDFDFWHWQEASLGCFFMSLGALYRLYEGYLTKLLGNGFVIVALLIGFCVTKFIVLTNSLEMMFGPIVVSSFPLFVVDNILMVVLLIMLFKIIPYVQWLGVTGKRSLVIYFVCGAVPLLVSKAFLTMGIHYSALSMPLVFTLVCVLASLIAFIIYRYLPFLVGVKNIQQ